MGSRTDGGLSPEQREDLIDTLWQAIDNRMDIDVGARDLAEAAVDALPSEYKAAPDMLKALRDAEKWLMELARPDSYLAEIINESPRMAAIRAAHRKAEDPDNG